MMFENRESAGKQLAERLADYRGKKGAIVLGIPRGGVVVADEIAQKLHLPMSLMIVRKIGAPNNPELAIGAISTDGKPHLNSRVIDSVGATREHIMQETERQFSEVKERMKRFGIKKQDFRGKIVLLADDGIATGATVIAAVNILRNQNVKKIVIAVPVCSSETASEVKPLVDEFICLEEPFFFSAVGQFYADFREVMDEEVRKILQHQG